MNKTKETKHNPLYCGCPDTCPHTYCGWHINYSHESVFWPQSDRDPDSCTRYLDTKRED